MNGQESATRKEVYFKWGKGMGLENYKQFKCEGDNPWGDRVCPDGTKVYAQVSVSGKPSLGIYPKNSNSSLSFNLIRWYCLDGSLEPVGRDKCPQGYGGGYTLMKGNIAYNQRAAYAGFEKSKVTDRIAYVLVRDRYFKTCEPIVF